MTIWKGSEMESYFLTPPDIKVEEHGIKVGVSQTHRITNNADVTIEGENVLLQGSFDEIEQENGFYRLSRGTYRVMLANLIEVPINTIAMIYPVEKLAENGVVVSCEPLESRFKDRPKVTIRLNRKTMKISSDMKWFKIVFMSPESMV